VRLLTGTSGFSYPAWKGPFYPTGLSSARMLGFYAARLAAVEVNATFYRMPSPEVISAWRGEVPAGFTFALKIPQRVTHVARLREVAEPLERFYRVAAELGPALGPLLFQLPPSLRRDLPRLQAVLAGVPAGVRAAFEFRHASWLDDGVLEALRGAGAALCLADTEEARTPLLATAHFGYLRLRRPDYTERDLRAWAERILAQPWGEAFAFFKHEEGGRGPALALALQALAGEGRAATPGR